MHVDDYHPFNRKAPYYQMIEVELKFKVSPEIKKKLIQDLQFVAREEFVDIYYDTKDYSLSLQNIWLRSRNDVFCLKIPSTPSKHTALDLQHNSPKSELYDLDQIRQSLGMSVPLVAKTFHGELVDAAFIPLYSYRNIREKYMKDSLIIDFDQAYWEDQIFEVCEIECNVHSEQEIPDAIEIIKEFAFAYGLKLEPVEARLFEIMKIQNPAHYRMFPNGQQRS